MRAESAPEEFHENCRDFLMTFDVTITAGDVQELSNADAVTVFFAHLGWRTDIRIAQNPGNLGIAL